ncbi:hypothetical protein D3C76_1551310 [compost metagenome]
MTKAMNGLIQAITLPSRTPKDNSLPMAWLPLSYSCRSALDDLTSRISDSTWLNTAVKDAVSSCMASEILYIVRPNGTRIKAASGITANMTRVIFQFK